jgi:hypothetical protein
MRRRARTKRDPRLRASLLLRNARAQAIGRFGRYVVRLTERGRERRPLTCHSDPAVRVAPTSASSRSTAIAVAISSRFAEANTLEGPS